jgi:hypothetical protein
MVPKVNAPGHLPAHTAFLGRIRDAPFAFTLLVMPHSHLGPLDFSSALTIPAITQRLQEATSVFGSALRITLLERIDALIWTLFVK